MQYSGRCDRVARHCHPLMAGQEGPVHQGSQLERAHKMMDHWQNYARLLGIAAQVMRRIRVITPAAWPRKRGSRRGARRACLTASL